MEENVKITLVYEGAPDNETVTSDILDMEGYEGIMFFAGVTGGEAYSVDMKVQSGADSGLSDAADLAGTLLAIDPAAGAPGQGVVDVWRPLEQYVRCAVVAADATSPGACHIWAVQYGAHNKPVANTNAEFHASPAEGTA